MKDNAGFEHRTETVEIELEVVANVTVATYSGSTGSGGPDPSERYVTINSITVDGYRMDEADFCARFGHVLGVPLWKILCGHFQDHVEEA